MTTPVSDEQLLLSMLSGNAEAFAELYDRRHGAIYRYALRMTGSEATAEDITQDVFLELMRDAQNFDETRGPLQAYIFGMARHRVLRRLQTGRNFVSLEEESGDEVMETNFTSASDPFMDFQREEIVGLVRQAVLSLPANFREVIVLCEFQELNYVDAARLIDCPVGTIRSRLNRARGMLVNKLRALQQSEVSSVEMKQA